MNFISNVRVCFKYPLHILLFNDRNLTNEMTIIKGKSREERFTTFIALLRSTLFLKFVNIKLVTLSEKMCKLVKYNISAIWCIAKATFLGVAAK